MIKLTNILNNKFFFLLLLFSYSLLISIIFYTEQRGLSSSLITSGKVLYPYTDAIFYVVQKNSWTLTYQILELFIYLGFNNLVINFLIQFFCFSLFLFGLFFISNHITKNNFFSFFLSVLILTKEFKFGNLDYPVLVLSQHTNGMLGGALFIFILGLVSIKKNTLAISLSIITLAIHPSIGLWINIILFVLFVLNYKYFKSEIFENKKFFFLSFILVLLSFFFFIINKKAFLFQGYDIESLKNYYFYWDLHRSNEKIDFLYIIKSLFLISIILYIFNNQIFKNVNKAFLKLVIIHIFLSGIVYCSFKMFINYMPIELKILMPNRYFVLHSITGYLLLISFFYSFLASLKNQIFFKILNLIIISYALVLFVTNTYKNYNYFIENISKKKNDKYFWDTLKNTKTKKLFLTTNDLCESVIQKSNKPILICIESIDFIPYQPYLNDRVKNIIQDIYKFKFISPPEKNKGGIQKDIYYKKTFENYTLEQWKKISVKYNLEGLVLPNSWKLKLKKEIVGNNYSFFKIE